ncbi:uncharacterized protein THITE_2150738 [Thermothielavioides terrestris NRRL 8126]|uniref:GPI inositol-deacylase n=1 Tax=Thermothielavioides terrestris (strain ATCC 38088 / NRRL 8126) TaxID=578455 RepID=G2R642_THETT|nr:uncharacterized protein THITE_2150738 [Thermothielavioides terrestris NRRL 8126]AEO67579.1 hypothetical protein THITE_2150738 [Thermothielavioides terrestris NRRL 8126]
MERLLESGKARAIGLSNFNILKTKQILDVARIIPAVNQVEIHPYFPQRELLEFSSRHGIILMAHQPLGGRPVPVVRAHSDEPFPTEDPTILRVAIECGMTPAQVCLSWAVQRGIPVIPKSVQEEHMKQNLQLKRLPDDAFRAVDDITLKRRPIRFLDPSRHLGFDIFDEDNDQPFKRTSKGVANFLRIETGNQLSLLHMHQAIFESSEHEFLAATASQMDQSQKRSFAGFLSRSGTEKSVQRGFVRTDTASSFLSVAASSLDLSDDEKGPLGLTTLYEPPPPATPVADIVFIHGLGGGSRKTWSYSPDPPHYWPQSWLPQDEDFADVRIHTYGYKADWGGRRQSVLDTHDFAQSLLGALRNHPAVRRSRTRIILVGHSMGGSVAKKAYILARQDPTAADLGARVHSMFFLATPHRGSDMATVLENMLAVAWGHKRFVSDLAPNSAALTAINDAFRHFAPELRLWSFYETLPTRGVNRIVVERHLATLGYHNEEVASMDADHRHVCKFDTPADPNYKVLRNALVSALDMIRSTSRADPERSHGAGGERDHPGLHQAPSVSAAEATAIVRSFLGVREPLEGDLATLQVLKQPGSCEWFTKKSCFTAWRDGTAPGILWLVGRPAAGKSVLACHVIEQLTPPHALCSYFICKHAKAGESTLSECFRSLAFQMAIQDTAVMGALLQLARDDLSWDKSDESSVWRRLFTNCIFKLPSLGKHFWVIDGLDACSSFGALFTKRLLASLPQHLRLFGTSRNLEEIERGLASLGASRASVQVLSDTDTIEDMRLFLSTRLSELGRPETAEDRERMCEKILRKATGSFLWARLVLQEFEDAWTEEAMDAILREIPADLSALYARVVQSIQADRRKLPLAKSILTWVVLASRPLTVDELRCAVKLDTNQTLQNAAKAIPDLCSQLVFIDQHDNVHMIHETAREFLLTETGELPPSMQKKRDHTRVASLLLKYLSSGVLKPLQGKAHHGSGRPRGFAKPAVTAAPADTSLLEYACAFFSEHLYRATSSDDPLMDELSDFLGTNNVLSWIEHIAAGGDLTPLSRTAMNLREYLGRRMKYVPPTDRSVQLVDGWATDLIRVAAKFRAQLLDCPSSIHSLIPSLCPAESTISRTSSKDARQSSFASTLTVKGLPPGSWDDCLIRMDFHKGQTTAVRHGVRYFAIGLSTGQISLYDPTSIQVLHELKHQERVRILEFSPDDLLLASCGTKHITVWDPKAGTMVSSFELHSPPLAVTFVGVDELLGAFRSCELIKWNLQTEEQECISWKQVGSQGGSGTYDAPEGIVPASPPSVAAFLTIDGEVLLAVGYRAHPILVWNALDLQLLGFCEPDIANNGIDTMVFNPNPEVPALLVALQGGSLCIFNYVTMEMLCRRPDVYANSVACSPDGRTVIIGSSQGLIEVFELEQDHNGAATTLNLIYRSNHPLDGRIVGVAFSADGLRFVDVRGQQGRVWAPAALPTRGMLDGLADPVITTHLIPSADGKFIVAGKSNGDVVLFSTADAAQAGILYRHARDASIVSISFVEARNLLISADIAGRVLAVQLHAPLSEAAASSDTERVSVLLDQRFGGAIASLLTNAAGNRVLVSGPFFDQLWELPSGRIFLPKGAAGAELAVTGTSVPPRPVSPAPNAAAAVTGDGTTASTAETRSAFQHPSNPDWFVRVTSDIARVYSWADFTELTAQEGIRLARELVVGSEHNPPSPTPPNASSATANASYHLGPGFVVELFRPTASSSARLYLWPAAEFDPSRPESVARPASEPNLAAVGPAVLSILRIVGPSTLLFLDIRLWVCSVELHSVTNTTSAGTLFRPVGFGRMPTSTSTPAAATAPRPDPRLVAPVAREPAFHARRHFFALSEWRTASGELRCSVAFASPSPSRGGNTAGRDIVAFANGHRLVVIHGGLEFAEDVVASVSMSGVGGGLGNGNTSQHVWSVVSGSMHRRSSNW